MRSAVFCERLGLFVWSLLLRIYFSAGKTRKLMSYLDVRQ